MNYNQKSENRVDKINLSVKAAEKQISEIINDNGLTDTAKQIKFVQMINVTNHVDTKTSHSKLAGLQSVSTSPVDNQFCRARAVNPDLICFHCFGIALINRYDNTEIRSIINGRILKNFLIDTDCWSLLPITTVFARIESFGDVENVIQARNYLRIIKSHKFTRFGIWSKNWKIWYKAFKLEGKPENCTFVFSSSRMGVVDQVPDCMVEYTDHVFTVYEKAGDHEINCGGRKCATCLRCYQKDTDYQVSELKK